MLSYQGRRREASHAIDELSDVGGVRILVLGLRMHDSLARGRSVLREAEEAEGLGVPPRQLVALLALTGGAEAAAARAQDLEPGSPEDLLYRALAAWRRGDVQDAVSPLRTLSKEPTFDYAAVAAYLLGEIAVQRGQNAEAVSALEAYRTSEVSCLRWGTPPLLAFRPFFACAFRSWAYPRSLYLLGLAHLRLGHHAEARARLEQLLTLWKRADPELPLLRESKALLRRVGPADAPRTGG